jgi:hypothetical protein
MKNVMERYGSSVSWVLFCLYRFPVDVGFAKENVDKPHPPLFNLFFFFFFFFVVLGLELRAYTLSHSTSPIFVKGVSR